MGKYVYVRTKKKGAGTPGLWPEAKKVELITTYIATGSLLMACGICKVPYATAKRWKTQPWFQEMIDNIQAEETTKLDAKLSGIVSKTLDVIVDRLEGGDYILDSKSGTVKRVPVKMRDAKSVMTDLFDKRQLIRKQPTQITESQTVDKRLAMLAENFAQFVERVPVKNKELPRTMDAEQFEVLEESQEIAVHDQRETGL